MVILPKLVAKAALFNKKGEILLIRRSSTDTRRPEQWDFPGGGIDKGETPDQAVIREIHEEIGVVIPEANINLMYTTTHYYDHGSTIRFVFVGKLSGDENIKLSFEHDTYQWFPIQEGLAAFDHPVYVDAIKYLVDHNLLHSE